ncbi:MAG TPA: RNA polymerase sigma factor [Ramlibacter sp.]
MPALHLEPVPTSATAASDRQLALSAASGNALAFETIVRRHNRLLFRTARGVVADDAEAQDVVQETYLRAFTNLHAFRGDSALGTWLARIAINVALSAQRTKGRLVQLEAGDDDGDAPEPEDAMPAQTTDDDAPDAAAHRLEIRALLQASIAELPPIYRTVFMLRAVEELSVAEAAFCLGVSEDVVKTRFLRARAMLRERLAVRVESSAAETFAFAGERCDAVLAHVMAELVRQGLVRLH